MAYWASVRRPGRRPFFWAINARTEQAHWMRVKYVHLYGRWVENLRACGSSAEQCNHQEPLMPKFLMTETLTASLMTARLFWNWESWQMLPSNEIEWVFSCKTKVVGESTVNSPIEPALEYYPPSNTTNSKKTWKRIEPFLFTKP